MNTNDKELDMAITILKSPIGKMMMAKMKPEFERQTIEYVKEKNHDDNSIWAAQMVMDDIKATSPKMLEIYKLVGISESDLGKLIREALT